MQGEYNFVESELANRSMGKCSLIGNMATVASRKMTFTLPEELAEILVTRVWSRLRSSYVCEAKLLERETRLRKACEAANAEAGVAEIERDWDSLNDRTVEPWIDAEAR